MARIRIIPPHGVVGHEIGDEYECGDHEADALVAQRSAVRIDPAPAPAKTAPRKGASK